MVSQRVSDTGVLTTVHLAIVAALAVLTVIGILWGARLKRQRTRAEHVEEERLEQLGGVPVEGDPARPLEEPSARTDTAVADQRAAGDLGATAPSTEAPRTRETRDQPAGETAARGEDAQIARPAAAAAPPVSPPPVAPPPPPADPGPVAGTPSLQDEPIAAAAPLDATPASEAEPEPAAPSPAPGVSYGDAPVTTLKGLGPKVAATLSAHGIDTVGDLAGLDDAAAQRLDVQLGAFTGRMRRDRWLEQARLLAAGDKAGYEATFGKL